MAGLFGLPTKGTQPPQPAKTTAKPQPAKTAVVATPTADNTTPVNFVPVFHVGGTFDGKPVDLNFSLNSAI